MSNEQMVKIELVGHSWQEWGDFAGVKIITIPKINLLDHDRAFIFRGKKWSYLPDSSYGYAIKIDPCGENVIDKPKQFAQPKPRPEWINFKTVSGFDVVINVKKIRSLIKHTDVAYIADISSAKPDDAFRITHETYEQIKKQLMGE